MIFVPYATLIRKKNALRRGRKVVQGVYDEGTVKSAATDSRKTVARTE